MRLTLRSCSGSAGRHGLILDAAGGKCSVKLDVMALEWTLSESGPHLLLLGSVRGPRSLLGTESDPVSPSSLTSRSSHRVPLAHSGSILILLGGPWVLVLRSI